MAFLRLASLLASLLLAGGLTVRAHELPRAEDDSAVVKATQSVDIDVLTNDFTPAGYPTTVVALTHPSIGSIAEDRPSSGVFRYNAPEVDEVTKVTFTYRIKAADPDDSASVSITITPLDDAVVAASGQEVPGAGSHPALPESARFRLFGLPAIDDSGAVAFEASYAFPTTKGPVTYQGIFGGKPLRVIAHAWHPAPNSFGSDGIVGSFVSFDDPMLNAVGYIAFGATTVSGTTLRRGLWLARNDDLLRQVVFEGDPAVGIPGRAGARFKKFHSSVLTDSGELHFVASFKSGATTGRGIWTTSEIGLQHVLSEGQAFQVGKKKRTLKRFAALSAVPGSQGHDRIAADGAFAVRLSWEDGGQSVAVVRGGEVDIRLTTGMSAPVRGGKYLKLGLPGLTADGDIYLKAKLAHFAPTEPLRVPVVVDGEVVQVVTISPEQLRIAAHNDDVLIVQYGSGDFDTIGREGSRLEPDVPDSRRFSRLGNPVISPNGEVAILASGTARADSSIRPALWFKSANRGIGTFYRGEPIGLSDRMKWHRFDSVAYLANAFPLSRALPSGTPLFTARTKQAGVTVDGLWVADGATGKFVAGSQQEVDIPYQGTKTVRKVHALKSAPRSPAQRRTYNSNEQVTYRLAFTDGTEAIIRDELP